MTSSSGTFVETAINNSFFVDRLENAAVDTEVPNRLSYHRVLLVETGSGKLIVDDHNFDVEGQELFLMAKGQVYIFEKSSVVSGHMLCFGDCFWEKTPASASNCKAMLFDNAAANQRLPLNDPELRELSFLFTALRSEYIKPHYTNQIDAMAAYLKIIMIKIANVRTTEESRFDSQDVILYRKFLELLTVNYRAHREVSDFAEMLGITSRRLSDVCKRCNNRSAKDMISGQLLAEAKRSLQFSSSPVKEIAYQLCFSTPEQFSHFFKKNTSFSPADYRRKFVHIGA